MTRRWCRDERGGGNQRGFVLVLVAFSLTMILTFAAILVDLGAAYWEAERIQNAADSGALGGAPMLPEDLAGAQTVATSLVSDHGYTDLTVVLGSRPTQLEVTVREEVDTYFGSIIGVDSISVARTAVAEYDQPVAMGSPSNTFGNQPDCSGCSTGDATPDFWADANGPGSRKSKGNAFATTVCSTEDNCVGGTNVDHELDGYYFNISNPAAGASLTISAFDIVYVDVGDTCEGSAAAELEVIYAATGDPRYEPGPASPYCTGDFNHGSAPAETPVTTHWRVLQPDDTPWDTSDNVPQPGCSGSVTGVADAAAAYADPTLRDQFFRQWHDLCSIPSAADGDWILNVWTSAGRGANRYSLQTSNTSGGAQPSITAAEYMTLYANADAANATFHLARIFPGAAGRRLVLNFFDMGDAAQPGTISVLPPTDSGMGSFSGCTYTPPPGFSTPDADGVWGTLTSTEAGCSQSGISSGAGWNGQWITWIVPIPDDFTCDFSDPFGCWVRINFQFPGGTNDTTSWEARLEGNPVRLVR